MAVLNFDRVSNSVTVVFEFVVLRWSYLVFPCHLIPLASAFPPDNLRLSYFMPGIYIIKR